MINVLRLCSVSAAAASSIIPRILVPLLEMFLFVLLVSELLELLDQVDGAGVHFLLLPATRMINN